MRVSHFMSYMRGLHGSLTRFSLDGTNTQQDYTGMISCSVQYTYVGYGQHNTVKLCACLSLIVCYMLQAQGC